MCVCVCVWPRPLLSISGAYHVPPYYYPELYGYRVVNLTDTDVGYNGTLQLVTHEWPFGGNVKTLALEIRMETETRLYVNVCYSCFVASVSKNFFE